MHPRSEPPVALHQIGRIRTQADDDAQGRQGADRSAPTHGTFGPEAEFDMDDPGQQQTGQ